LRREAPSRRLSKLNLGKKRDQPERKEGRRNEIRLSGGSVLQPPDFCLPEWSAGSKGE
jgi:hypothetical protein